MPVTATQSSTYMRMTRISMEQATALTETQSGIQDSATQTAMVHLGLPLTMALQSSFKGLSYSTGQVETYGRTMGNGPETLMCASQMSFQLLAARCFLAEPSSANLLDLALMGNTSSSQVKSNCGNQNF